MATIHRLSKADNLEGLRTILHAPAAWSSRSREAPRTTTALGVTLREQTERRVIVTERTNWPPTGEGVVRSLQGAVKERSAAGPVPEGSNGRASVRILGTLIDSGGLLA